MKEFLATMALAIPAAALLAAAVPHGQPAQVPAVTAPVPISREVVILSSPPVAARAMPEADSATSAVTAAAQDATEPAAVFTDTNNSPTPAPSPAFAPMAPRVAYSSCGPAGCNAAPQYQFQRRMFRGRFFRRR